MKEKTDERTNIFVALDVETTGFSPISNELIEISAIKYKGTRKIDNFSTLLKPSQQIPQRITQITGITNELVLHAPCIKEIQPLLIDFISNYTIVAHNASFDMKFLQENFRGNFKQNRVIDTVQLSRQMFPKLENHKLGTVAKHIGIKEDGFHRAEFDCECCAKIYMEYLQI